MAATLQPDFVGCTDLRLEGDRISLHVQGTRLQNILADLARQGIIVRIDPAINPVLTLSLDNRELQSGLDAIIHPSSYALVWKSQQAVVAGPPTLSELQVFQAGHRDAMQYLAANGTVHNASPAPTAAHLPGEFLLRFSDGAAAAQLEDILRQTGGVVIARDTALGIYRIKVDEQTDIPLLTQKISRLAGVQAEPNYLYSAPSPQKLQAATTAAVEQADQETNGVGNTAVAVLDSGLLTGVGLEPYIRATYDPLQPGEPISDSMGHGTQMAMIASGMVVPDGAEQAADEDFVPVIAVKIFDDQGLSSNYTLLQAITYAVESNAGVLSLSWETESRSDFLEQTLDSALDQGTIILAAAGNEPTGNPVYPAAYDGVIGVGALASDGTVWDSSNFGDFVDIYAPGIAYLPVGNEGEAGIYGGTSIATAYLARKAADYLSAHPDASKDELYTALGLTTTSP